MKDTIELLCSEKIDVEKLARDSYCAYGQVTDFKNFRCDPMPIFSELPEKIKAAWLKASTYAFCEGMRYSQRIMLKQVEEFEQER